MLGTRDGIAAPPLVHQRVRKRQRPSADNQRRRRGASSSELAACAPVHRRAGEGSTFGWTGTDLWRVAKPFRSGWMLTDFAGRPGSASNELEKRPS
jgi:hypothetical protein